MKQFFISFFLVLVLCCNAQIKSPSLQSTKPFSNKSSSIKLSTNEEETYLKMYNQADEFFENGDYQKAIKILEKMKVKWPKDFYVYDTLAWLKWSLSVDARIDAVKIGEAYMNANPLDPDRGDIVCRILAGEQNWFLVTEVQRQILDNKYEGAPALLTYNFIIIAYEKMENYTKAFDYVKRGLKDYPKDGRLLQKQMIYNEMFAK